MPPQNPSLTHCSPTLLRSQRGAPQPRRILTSPGPLTTPADASTLSKEPTGGTKCARAAVATEGEAQLSRQRFADRVIIVTGGGSGLGEDYCSAYVAEGGRVICADVDETAAARTTAALCRRGGQAIAVACDVTKSHDVARMVEAALHAFGRIDVLVNNAGVIRRRSLVGTSDDDWDREIDTDLKGPFLCARAAVPHMIERGYGKIVNISSVAGIVGCISTAYAASKAGINGLTRQWALELAPHGIRVNSVAPGYTATPINEKLRQTSAAKRIGETIPLGWGKPADITAAVLFLSASESDYITGQTLAVDGGLTTTIDMGPEYRTFDR
jgi:3-oxoacyl-[acyl-carrier protein] reductase